MKRFGIAAFIFVCAHLGWMPMSVGGQIRCAALFSAEALRYEGIGRAEFSKFEAMFRGAIAESEHFNPSDAKPSEAYQMTFTMENMPTPSIALGNILRVYQGYAAHIREKSEYNAFLRERSAGKPVTVAPPVNEIVTKVGMQAMKMGMIANCRSSCTSLTLARSARMVKDFFKIYDLHGAGNGFSGSLFFGDYQTKFVDQDFQKRTIFLESELHDLIVWAAQDPNFRIQTNIFELAVDVNDGNKQKAIEMLGLLMSRDLSVIQYFDYISVANKDFVRSVGMIPMQVRLLAEIDRVQRASDLDRFSYDGTYSSSSTKNYYFWSGAYVAPKLAQLGYTPNEIAAVTMELPRQYKIFRHLQKYWPVPNAPAVVSIDAVAIPGAGFGGFGAHPSFLMATGGEALYGGTGLGMYEFAMVQANARNSREVKGAAYRKDAIQVIRNSVEGAMRALKWTKPEGRESSR